MQDKVCFIESFEEFRNLCTNNAGDYGYLPSSFPNSPDKYPCIAVGNEVTTLHDDIYVEYVFLYLDDPVFLKAVERLNKGQ